MKKIVFMMSIAVATFVAESSPQQTARQIVPDYDSYVPADFLEVDQGRVKAQRVTEIVSRIIIEAPANSKVTLKSNKPVKRMFLRNLRENNAGPLGARVVGPGNSINIPIGPDGIAWLVYFHPPPEISVYEYDPKSVLKVSSTAIERARFPVVDVHTHVLSNRAAIEERLKVMDAVNVAVVIDDSWSRSKFKAEKPPERFLPFATIGFERRREPSFGEETAARIEQEAKTYGIAGIAEVLARGGSPAESPFRQAEEEILYIDDARFMPIWRAAAKLKIPVLLHTGERPEFRLPVDKHNELLPAIGRKPGINTAGLPVMELEEVRHRRNRILEEVPNLTVIAAHMDFYGHDLQGFGEMLRKYATLHVEIGNNYEHFARTPRAARKFFIEFQNRLLYGGDGMKSINEYREEFRLFETADENMRLFTYSSLWPLYGLDLPDGVLKKLYYANAARIIPGVKERLLKLHPHLDFPE